MIDVAVDNMNHVGEVSTTPEAEEVVTKKYDTPVGLTVCFETDFCMLLKCLAHLQYINMK